jgi:multidrug resistance efflux pump
MIRWGITAVFSIVLLIIVASWFIKYPDMLTSRVIITTQTPPASLIARADGPLKLFVKNNQSVKRGDYLALVENPTHPDDVRRLVAQMEEFKRSLYRPGTPLEQHAFPENLMLGELQSSYATFLNNLKAYARNKTLNGYEKQIMALQNRQDQYQQLDRQLAKQRLLLAEQLKLAKKRLSVDLSLFKDKVIAESDLDRTKDTYLQAERAVESAQTTILNNQIMASQLQFQLMELRVTKEENEGKLRNAVETAFKNLESQYQLWQQRYVLQTPAGGKVAFVKYWSNNQFIRAGEEVMTIVPDSGSIFGQVLMPVVGSGKVEIGQVVHIRFDNYPSYEYGMVTGRIKSISPIPRDGFYTIQITLTQGLMTSYRKKLPFKQEMQGTAEIVTQDLRLIERIFHQLRSLVDKST